MPTRITTHQQRASGSLIIGSDSAAGRRGADWPGPRAGPGAHVSAHGLRGHRSKRVQVNDKLARKYRVLDKVTHRSSAMLA